MDKCDPRQICLDHRLDIFFRVFVLDVLGKAIWKEFYTAPGNEKIEKEKDKKSRGLFDFEANIRKRGQKTKVHLARLDKKLYPASGATRISSMLYLQLPIKYTIVTNADLVRVVTAESPCFEALSGETKEQFFSWKKQWEEEYYNEGKH